MKIAIQNALNLNVGIIEFGGHFDIHRSIRKTESSQNDLLGY